jgi:hypothetical protein
VMLHLQEPGPVVRAPAFPHSVQVVSTGPLGEAQQTPVQKRKLSIAADYLWFWPIIRTRWFYGG